MQSPTPFVGGISSALAISVDEALSIELGDGVSGLIFVPDQRQPLDQPQEALAVLKRCAPIAAIRRRKSRAVLGRLVDFGGSFGLNR